MFDKLELAEGRYIELGHKLSSPETMSNQSEYVKLSKEMAELAPLVEKFEEYKKTKKEITNITEMLSEELDKELKEIAECELQELRSKLEQIQKDFKIFLLPKDPNDERSVIIEIRAGAGGEEAALFVGVLFRMYTKYAEKSGWRVEVMDSSPTEIGGFKEIVFEIDARGVYSRLKFESGVHRVQRVPTTEANGRIHTSTVTVAVLPEVDDVEVNVNPTDLRIDTYRASGAGGQHINKTDSAIRITHIPTGLVVACQDERSQHKNKDRAMKILRSKLFEMAKDQQASEIAESRRSQVGTGDRSERIRTYNYPQGRVTDHRIGLTIYNLDGIFEGNIDDIVDALIADSQTEKLANNKSEFDDQDW